MHDCDPAIFVWDITHDSRFANASKVDGVAIFEKWNGVDPPGTCKASTSL